MAARTRAGTFNESQCFMPATVRHPALPEPDGVLQELELAAHGDDAHLENLGPALRQAVKVGRAQPQLMQQQHLRAPGSGRSEAAGWGGEQGGMCRMHAWHGRHGRAAATHATGRSTMLGQSTTKGVPRVQAVPHASSRTCGRHASSRPHSSARRANKSSFAAGRAGLRPCCCGGAKPWRCGAKPWRCGTPGGCWWRCGTPGGPCCR